MTKPPTATLLVLALAVGTLVVVLSSRPHPPREPLGECVSEASGLITETQMLRQFAKEQIALEVREGRRPLLEAAALFGALNRLAPELPPLWVSDVDDSQWHFSARTNEEKLCRQVVAWVGRRTLPDQADAVVTRLSAEYRWQLSAQGDIRIPDLAGLEPVQELLERVREGLTKPERQSVDGRRPGGS